MWIDYNNRPSEKTVRTKGVLWQNGTAIAIEIANVKKPGENPGKRYCFSIDYNLNLSGLPTFQARQAASCFT